MESNRIFLRERSSKLLKEIYNSNETKQLAFFGLNDTDALKKELKRIENGQYDNYYSGIYYDLILKEGQRHIGSAGFHTWWRDHDRAEIGYWLNEEKDRRQGYMNELLPVLLDYGFEKMKLHRVEAITAMDNEASIKLLEKFGFQKEGIVHEHYKMPDGTYDDDYKFYLLKGNRIKP